MGNGPHAIAPWGGNRGLFGTNPIGFAAPRENDAPLIIDMSLSKVARGKINVAAEVMIPFHLGGHLMQTVMRPPMQRRPWPALWRLWGMPKAPNLS